MFNVAVFFIGFVLAVVLGQKLKINAGFIAIFFGFILTWIFGGEGASSNTFIRSFPVSLFWNYAMPVIFYAFAAANGTLQTLGKKVSYQFRNARWALPIAVYLVAGIVAAAGAGTMNTAIVAPLAWGFCMAAGVNPLIVAAACWSGSFLGSFVPWTSNGALLTGLYQEYLPMVDSDVITVRVAAYYAIMATVFIVVMYIVTKAWKLDGGTGNAESVMEKPSAFTKEQKITLCTIFVCIGLLLIPSILNQIAPNAIFRFMKSNFGIPVTSIAGISIVAVFGGVNMKDVFAKHVNWHIIFLITGMGMYCTLATTMGVVETLGQELQAMPAGIVAPAISLIGSALSFVTSASTVQPLLFAMIPALATASGIQVEALVGAMMIGVACTSFSPVSTGGAMSTVGAPEGVADKIFPKMLMIAVINAIICALIAATPFYAIGL